MAQVETVVAAYGDVGNDPNPIPFSDEAAQALGFPRAIAHAMNSGALLSRMPTRNLGGGLGQRRPAEHPLPGAGPGSTVTSRDVVTGVDPAGGRRPGRDRRRHGRHRRDRIALIAAGGGSRRRPQTIRSSSSPCAAPA